MVEQLSSNLKMKIKFLGLKIILDPQSTSTLLPAPSYSIYGIFILGSYVANLNPPSSPCLCFYCSLCLECHLSRWLPDKIPLVFQGLGKAFWAPPFPSRMNRFILVFLSRHPSLYLSLSVEVGCVLVCLLLRVSGGIMLANIHRFSH